LTCVPRIVCYGASGMSAASARNVAHGGPRPLCEVVAYIDDTRGGQGLRFENAPVISFEEWEASWRDFPCMVAVGDPRDRRRLVERLSAKGGHFPRLYDAPDVAISGVAIGAGTGIAVSAYLNPPNITIGDHVQILPMCSIGHDVRIEDFVTICPGCVVSGYVTIETGVFLGAGSTVVNGTARKPLVIGAAAKVSAGSVVTKSVPAGTTVAGNPARNLRELARAHKIARVAASDR
jgi:sugar O-acyltransferase (sialic acid O-acetyltransferase NeuD family)